MATAVDGSRRASEPHHHIQPKYPEPEIRSRRNTETTALHRVRSRPEDYKNKPRPANMVEYICFDSQDRPVKCNEAREEQRPSTRRRERPSRSRRYDASIDDDGEESSHSEDELTLPTNYRSPSGRRGSRSGSERAEARPEAQPYVQDERQYADPAPPSSRQRSHSPQRQSHHRSHQQSRYLQPVDHRQSFYPEQRRRSWHGPDRDDDYFDTQPITRHNTYDHSESPYDSRTQHHHHSNQRNSSPLLSSETAGHLIAQVAEHLQTHKSAYSKSKHGDGSELVNELMGQVVRKVADGSLNGDMMKEIVREVQRVL